MDEKKNPVLRYSRAKLMQLVWRVKECEDVPEGFSRDVVRSPEDMFKYKFLFDDFPCERFLVFVMSAGNRVTAVDVISEGLLNSSLTHPREVFRACIEGLGASVILAHNHPSGNPEPSQEDIAITRQLVEAGKVNGIPVHDHVIFTRNSYTSFAERGLL
jgi:DNA repair protein RadC